MGEADQAVLSTVHESIIDQPLQGAASLVLVTPCVGEFVLAERRRGRAEDGEQAAAHLSVASLVARLASWS